MQNSIPDWSNHYDTIERHYIFSVTDDMFKQWQRDYKIKELCKEITHNM